MGDAVGGEGERPVKKSLRVVLKFTKKTSEEATGHAPPAPEVAARPSAAITDEPSHWTCCQSCVVCKFLFPKSF